MKPVWLNAWMAGAWLSFAMLTACVSIPAQAPQDNEKQVEDHAEIDAFTLVIDAERWGVMMDNASVGATAHALEKRASDALEERDMRYRIDFALRSGVRQLIALRDGLCVDGHSPEISCNTIELPAWVREAPAPLNTSLQEFQARSDWLGEMSNPLIGIGCKLGVDASADEMFCAVE